MSIMTDRSADTLFRNPFYPEMCALLPSIYCSGRDCTSCIIPLLRMKGSGKDLLEIYGRVDFSKHRKS